MQGVGNFVNTGVLLILLCVFNVTSIANQKAHHNRLEVRPIHGRQLLLSPATSSGPANIMELLQEQSVHRTRKPTDMGSEVRLLRRGSEFATSSARERSHGSGPLAQGVWRTAFGLGMIPLVAILLYRIFVLRESKMWCATPRRALCHHLLKGTSQEAGGLEELWLGQICLVRKCSLDTMGGHLCDACKVQADGG